MEITKGRFDRRDRRRTLAALLLLFARFRRSALVALVFVFAAHVLFVGRAIGSRPVLPIGFSAGALSARLPVPESDRAFSGARSVAALIKENTGTGSISTDRRSPLEMILPGYQASASVLVSNLPQMPKGLGGVLSPEAAGKMESGLSLSERELETGLRRNSENQTGTFSTRRVDALAGAADETTAASAVSPDQNAAPELLERLTGSNPAAPRGERLSFYSHSGDEGVARASQGANQPLCSGTDCATYRLAEAVAYSCTAAPNGTSCPQTFQHCSEGTCASEFASRTSGSPFNGATSNDGQIFLTPGEPVPVNADARPALLAMYAQAGKEQDCERRIDSGNSAVLAANESFAGCCNRAESAWQSCASGCSGDAKCLRACGQTSNNASMSCEQGYMSAYNSISGGEDSSCGANTQGKSVGLSPWNVPFHCVQH